MPSCHCELRTVCLKDPKSSCRVASDVLLKTMRFLQSLPSFCQLPQRDQLLLLKHRWVPLFVLGLAQDKIVFEVTDRPKSSLLREILLGPGSPPEQTEQPTLRDIYRLRTCLHQLWNLNLTAKEYAYLKGALLFDPGKSVELYTLLSGSSEDFTSICFSGPRAGRLVLHSKPPTGSRPCAPGSYPPAAGHRLGSLQGHRQGGRHRSDSEPQPGHRAVLPASPWQHKHVSFFDSAAVNTVTFMTVDVIKKKRLYRMEC